MKRDGGSLGPDDKPIMFPPGIFDGRPTSEERIIHARAANSDDDAGGTRTKQEVGQRGAETSTRDYQ
jgi:hypothetical protein